VAGLIFTVNFVVILLGLTLLIFNRRIGVFLEEHGNLYNLKIEKLVPWYPRLNVIIVGLFFTIGGSYNIINQIMNWK